MQVALNLKVSLEHAQLIEQEASKSGKTKTRILAEALEKYFKEANKNDSRII